MDQAIIWSPGVTLAAIEKQVIIKAMNFFRGNKTATATALGISIRTLDGRLDEYGAAELKHKESDERERQKRADFLARSRGLPGSTASHAVAAAVLPNAALSSEREDDVQQGGVGDAVLPDTDAVGGALPAPGIRLESGEDAGSGVSMPMPNRGGVQKVLPPKAATRSARKAGG